MHACKGTCPFFITLLIHVQLLGLAGHMCMAAGASAAAHPPFMLAMHSRAATLFRCMHTLPRVPGPVCVALVLMPLCTSLCTMHSSAVTVFRCMLALPGVPGLVCVAGAGAALHHTPRAHCLHSQLGRCECWRYMFFMVYGRQ